jgi:muramoyltetrapeptide carboxypeptidase
MSDVKRKPLAIPPALKPGDAISIVAPASSPKRERFEAAMANLTSMGYRPKTYRDFCTPHGYLSGTDEERIAELEAAFRDPETTMVLAVRGGYGCGRIVDRVNFSLLTARPKIVCGYSDLTALHAAIQRRCGLVSFHGPNLVAGLGAGEEENAAETAASFAMFRGVSVSELTAPFNSGLKALHPGVALGQLIGGNLAVLMGLLGTPDEPEFDGAILMIEDTGEAPYRVDRLLTQLRTSGRLGKIRGAVLGYFSDYDKDDRPTADEVLAEFFAPLGVPVIAGAPFGHEHPNLPLPMGATVRLDADAPGLELLQPVVMP